MMDMDKWLQEMRFMCAEINQAIAIADENSIIMGTSAFKDLADKFIVGDHWLTTGGHLPQDWKLGHAEDIQQRSFAGDLVGEIYYPPDALATGHYVDQEEGPAMPVVNRGLPCCPHFKDRRNARPEGQRVSDAPGL